MSKYQIHYKLHILDRSWVDWSIYDEESLEVAEGMGFTFRSAKRMANKRRKLLEKIEKANTSEDAGDSNNG